MNARCRGAHHTTLCIQTLKNILILLEIVFLGIESSGQHLKSAPQEDFFNVAMLRYVSCFPSCQEGFFNVVCADF